MSFLVSDILSWFPTQVVNKEALGEKIEQIQIHSASQLGVSEPKDIAFFFSKTIQDELKTAQPGVLVTGKAFVPHLEAAKLPLWSKTAILAYDDPYFIMAKFSEKFAEKFLSGSHTIDQLKVSETKIHPTAVIDPSVELGEGVQIGPYCIIQEKVKIGPHSVLYGHCHIGPQVVIGENSVLFPHVVLYESTQIGSRVRLHSGAVLGADGFGYAPIRKPQSSELQGHQKIHHFGKVVVGDDVEIGANTTIDRGTFANTVIHNHVKIDNQVHLGHNVQVEEGAILCGCVGVSGSSTIGKYAYIGGAVGISNQIHVGAGALVGGMSLITKDIPPRGKVAGNPQRSHRDHFRLHAKLNKMIQEEKPENE